MIPKQFRVLGKGAAIVFGGFLTLNLAATVAIGAFRSVAERKRKKFALPCGICKGKGFYLCKLCNGNATIKWSPLYDPIHINPCVCPTCDGNRVQRCLNCLGKVEVKLKLLFLPSQGSRDLALVLDITDLNMPKERRDRSLSSDRCKRSPFSCHQSSPKFPYETEENLKEWEDARCPVCIEHPHNAILLFCKSFSDSCTTPQDNQQEGAQLVTTDVTATSESNVSELQEERTEEGPSTPSTVSCEKQVLSKLVCPLCRGEIKDCVVVEPARHFMNAKSRSCSSETCNFTGSYKDLRKHARLEHPSVRPSEADPERQRNWRRLERQRDLGDLLSTLQSSFGEERADDSIIPIDDGSWLTVFFLIRVFQPGSSPRSSSWSGTSRARAQLRIRRRSTRLWGEGYDGETGSTRDEDNESSDGESFPRRRRVRRRTSPDNHP
ncbi:hypothetical protein GQ457_03G045970 [Hibiscus cannabinus]